MSRPSDDWWAPAELARIYRVPVGTIYRWASEDRWRRVRRGRAVRYHGADAQNSYDQRRTADAATCGEV